MTVIFFKSLSVVSNANSLDPDEMPSNSVNSLFDFHLQI